MSDVKKGYGINPPALCAILTLSIICTDFVLADDGAHLMRTAANSAQSCPLADESEINMPENAMPVGRSLRAPTAEETARCLKGMAEVKRLVRGGHGLVIDVRENTDSLSMIDGAIAIPLYAVRTKSFITDRNVVLLGNGINERQLVRECVRLQSTGAKRVQILSGGVRTWMKSRVGSTQNGLSLKDKIVKAKDIHSISLNNEWLVITDSSAVSKKRELKELFSGVPVLAFSAGNNFIKALRKSKKSKILVVTSEGDGYHALHAYLQNNAIQKTTDFYLEGGAAAYRQYLLTQKAYQERLRQLAAKKSTLCGG